MRLVPSVTASFVLLVSMAVFAQEWIEYSSRADLFFVNFPSQPQVRDISYTSEFGATFPARVYAAEQGPSRYSVTVVDYTDAERIHTERAKQCHPLAHSGCAGSEDPDGVQGAGSWKYERAGAVDFVSFNVLRRKAEMTYFGWAAIDRVAGRYIHLTNPDRSRSSSPSTCTKIGSTSWKRPCRRGIRSPDSSSSRCDSSTRRATRPVTKAFIPTDTRHRRVPAAAAAPAPARNPPRN